MKYDRIIIGAGLYGLYAATFCGKKDEKVLVLEYDKEPFSRATYVNQARVHMGYHYPRSFSTAIKSAHYFDRFCEEYGFSIHERFDQIYATSQNFSWTTAEQFKKFCDTVNIKCQELNPNVYFKRGMCDGAFLTTEYTYDVKLLEDYFLKEIDKRKNIDVIYGFRIKKIEKKENEYIVSSIDGREYETQFLLNATYASVNQILNLIGYEKFEIKYELCEIILCSVNGDLKNKGITVMDGPFFSIMPFGKTGYHSLTSVTFTPHETSYDEYPIFKCQNGNEHYCSYKQLGNCNLCSNKPQTAWTYMSSMAKKYIKDEMGFKYEKSLFSMKPILKASEIDDSRPTVIKKYSENPTFISVLSGKINTVYDLDEVLM
ncbi:FAD-dependent oxidoreductase [uncultured Clostridium sp.]|uniref:FAD-dependent oxidoreductase n=1 Tax=uncultured Clostridium sp. TaxID=59620 RepID=UPI0025E505BA|nr:FAD-dependent oxidoreductase [uncultured Clostridium sp.]